VLLVFAEDIGESWPIVMPVKGSWSGSGGGEVEVAMEAGASDAAGGRVSILCIPNAEVEGVASVRAKRSWPVGWPCSSARTAS
jgi:hypothetical protein